MQRVAAPSVCRVWLRQPPAEKVGVKIHNYAGSLGGHFDWHGGMQRAALDPGKIPVCHHAALVSGRDGQLGRGFGGADALRFNE